MEDHQSLVADKPARRAPWNKGKLVGAKPPLRPSHVWSIRTKLQMQGRQRDLALFNLAIDSFVVATWLLSASTTWRRAGTRWTVRPFANVKPVGPCGSSLPTRHAWRSTNT
jgi:hypothetical protein